MYVRGFEPLIASLKSLYTEMHIARFEPLINAFSADCAPMLKRGFKLWITAFDTKYSWMRMWDYESSTFLDMVVQ